MLQEKGINAFTQNGLKKLYDWGVINQRTYKFQLEKAQETGEVESCRRSSGSLFVEEPPKAKKVGNVQYIAPLEVGGQDLPKTPDAGFESQFKRRRSTVPECLKTIQFGELP
jgi:hypothetical protein